MRETVPTSIFSLALNSFCWRGRKGKKCWSHGLQEGGANGSLEEFVVSYTDKNKTVEQKQLYITLVFNFSVSIFVTSVYSLNVLIILHGYGSLCIACVYC